jgi:ubiquinone/menaquinone biosynthesis C-methylase UbiE
MNYQNHTNCRICNSDKLTPYLDLGNLPLSNNLATSETDPIHDQKYPLKVLFCETCGLSQLSVVIPPEVMFSHYVYRSSISKDYRDHCRNMAIDLKKRFGLTEDSFHIDIAGNDGALLNEFKQVVGGKMLNVDPATNMVKINDELGIRMFNTFWGYSAANHLRSNYWPMADLITATNVIAHVDNIKEFLSATKTVLKQTGVVVLEFPYLIDFIEKREFDTVYHEHLSYLSVYPITLLCEQIGLTVMSVEKFEIHGGSIRVIIGYGEQDSSVGEFVRHEREKYGSTERYHQFADDVQLTLMAFRNGLKSLTGRVAGFAASAKGSTLMNCAGITSDDIEYIIDDTPEKQGKFSAGVKIPIYSIDHMAEFPPDYIILLSWNFADSCMKRCRENGYLGKFILPLTFEII